MSFSLKCFCGSVFSIQMIIIGSESSVFTCSFLPINQNDLLNHPIFIPIQMCPSKCQVSILSSYAFLLPFSPTPFHLSLWLFNTVSWFCYTFLDFRVLKLNSAEGCFSELLNNTINLWPCAQRHSQHQLPFCSAAPTSSLLCLHHSQPASDNASAPHLVTKNSAVPSPFSYN